uniref:Uncharacterized protein n=1 Tax=Pristionchus pacificus TaxID=54126 RepID=A0A2A6CUZ3_PRIPA|eukprot:PDM82052.1 hypothetical protein PRIPAC_36445 [Pristionchus pacificus]
MMGFCGRKGSGEFLVTSADDVAQSERTTAIDWPSGTPRPSLRELRIDQRPADSEAEGWASRVLKVPLPYLYRFLMGWAALHSAYGRISLEKRDEG